jgi:hypothetical protein
LINSQKFNNESVVGDFSAKAGRENIFKPRLVMGVYMKLVVIMELE